MLFRFKFCGPVWVLYRRSSPEGQVSTYSFSTICECLQLNRKKETAEMAGSLLAIILSYCFLADLEMLYNRTLSLALSPGHLLGLLSLALSSLLLERACSPSLVLHGFYKLLPRTTLFPSLGCGKLFTSCFIFY